VDSLGITGMQLAEAIQKVMTQYDTYAAAAISLGDELRAEGGVDVATEVVLEAYESWEREK